MKSVKRGWLGSEMFTLRTATVTISAPEAATAAAFSSRLLYLPVPTISREVKLRPATDQLSAGNDWGAFISLLRRSERSRNRRRPRHKRSRRSIVAQSPDCVPPPRDGDRARL